MVVLMRGRKNAPVTIGAVRNGSRWYALKG